MSEENVDKLIEAIKKKSYIPSDWYGVSDVASVSLSDVLDLIAELRDKKPNIYMNNFLW